MKKMIFILLFAGLCLLSACQRPDGPMPTGAPDNTGKPTQNPVLTAIPVASPTPDAATQQPTKVPEQTETPMPSASPKPSVTSTPTPTIEPTIPAQVSPTVTEPPKPPQKPTPAPAVTKAPEPTVAITPTPTPDSAETIRPTATPSPFLTPTETPIPTATPTPTMAPELRVHAGWQKTESICGGYTIVFPELFDEVELIQGQKELIVRYTSTEDAAVTFYVLYTMQQTGLEVLDNINSRNVNFISENQDASGICYLLQEDGVMYRGILLEERYSKELLGNGFGEAAEVIGTMQVILAYPGTRTEYMEETYSFYVVPKQ